MSDSGAAALSLIEALIEHLEAEGVLTPENIDAIYDSALLRVQGKTDASAGSAADLQVRFVRPRRQ